MKRIQSHSRPNAHVLSETEKVEARKIAEAEAILAKVVDGNLGERVVGEPTAPITIRFREPILA